MLAALGSMGLAARTVMRNLRSVNLNLLPVLRELLRRQNVTHAAEALNMSQPAVSEALGKLRQIFQDDILVSEGRKFRLTAFAERLSPTLETSLGHLETLLCAAAPEPRDLVGSIIIATADYVVLAFGPELIRRVAEKAPRLTIHFVDINEHSADELAKGGIDFMLTPAAASNFEQAPLFEDDVVCLVNRKSPIVGRISEEQFWMSRHAAFSPGNALELSLHSVVLSRLGRKEFNAVLVQNFLLLPFLVENSNMIAIVQRKLAERLMLSAAVRIVELPFDFPKLQINAVWDRSRTRDPVHRWIRDRMLGELDRDTRGAAVA